MGLVNFRLQLLKGSRLYLVFYIFLLKPALEITLLATNKEIQLKNNLNVYKIKKLLDTRIINNNQQKYLIK